LAALLIVKQMHGQAGVTAQGQQAFSQCAGCHGLDGAGGEHAPNIATDPRVQRMSDAALLAIIKNGIPAAGMPSFSKLLNDQQTHAVLAYLRSLQGARSDTPVPGNAMAGRELFFGKAACSQCHMMNGRGGSLGTDLSGYGKSHSPAAIREAILKPGKNLDPRYGTVMVITKSGQSYRGLIRNQDNFSLQIQTADGAFHFFDKTNVARTEMDPAPLMPSDYGTKLTQSEIDDLISFLSQPADSPAKQENDEDE
jgi:putative heme-binding domain-containing protein